MAKGTATEEDEASFSTWCSERLQLGFRQSRNEEDPVTNKAILFTLATVYCPKVIKHGVTTLSGAPSVQVEHAAFICANVS